VSAPKVKNRERKNLIARINRYIRGRGSVAVSSEGRVFLYPVFHDYTDRRIEIFDVTVFGASIGVL